MTSVPKSGLVLVMHPGHIRLEPVQHPITPPRDGEALVMVQACGVCGSDVFLQEGGFGPGSLPVVPGHEAAGIVVAVGSPTDEDWVGRQVALDYIDAPEPEFTRSGHENMGPDIRRMGVDVDGAFAEFITRPIATLIPVDPPLDPAVVAVATDALATPYHALTSIAGLRADETLAVIGLGGIGSNAVQIGRYLGARVVAVGRGEAKLEQARQLGATTTVRSADGSAAVIDAAGGQIDVVLQCVGENPAMDRLAIDVAGYRARVVFVGVSREPFAVSATELIWRELSLLGSRGFTRADIVAVLGLVRSGALSTEHLTAVRRPLIEADEALDDLRAGRVLRTVLMMDTQKKEQSHDLA